MLDTATSHAEGTASAVPSRVRARVRRVGGRVAGRAVESMKEGAVEPVVIEVAGPTDIGDAIAVQHRAFQRVARWLGLDDATKLAPVAESVADVERLVADEGTLVLVARLATGGLMASAGGPDSAAVCDGASGPGETARPRIVGTVRGAVADDGSVEIGRLAVDDGFEGRGIGRALMVAIESRFPDAERFVLFTGKNAEGPIRLYESLGYAIRDEEEFRPGMFLVWMEKCRGRRVDSTA